MWGGSLPRPDLPGGGEDQCTPLGQTRHSLLPAALPLRPAPWLPRSVSAQRHRDSEREDEADRETGRSPERQGIIFLCLAVSWSGPGTYFEGHSGKRKCGALVQKSTISRQPCKTDCTGGTPRSLSASPSSVCQVLGWQRLWGTRGGAHDLCSSWPPLLGEIGEKKENGKASISKGLIPKTSGARDPSLW